MTKLSSLAAMFLLAVWPSSVYGQNVGYGETYESLDAAARMLLMQYADVSVVSRRSVDGNLLGSIHTLAGDQLGKMEVDSHSERLRLLFVGEPVRELDLTDRPFEKLTLDWAAAQTYAVWQSMIVLGPGALVGQVGWRGNLLLPEALGSHETLERPGFRPAWETPLTIRTEFESVYALSRLNEDVEDGGPTFTTSLYSRETEATGCFRGESVGEMVHVERSGCRRGDAIRPNSSRWVELRAQHGVVQRPALQPVVRRCQRS